jgi:PAT family beta-lactamase induction signal transducer AmpG
LSIPLLTPLLGRRRSWLLLAQVTIVLGLLGMAAANPQDALTPLVGFALLVAFGSATQDIALDAFRIESASARLQAVLAASYQTGYRLAMIWAGAGVFWIAAKAEMGGLPAGTYQDAAWAWAYTVMAISMAVGMATVLFSKEPVALEMPPAHNLRQWLHVAVVAPFLRREPLFFAACCVASHALIKTKTKTPTNNQQQRTKKQPQNRCATPRCCASSSTCAASSPTTSSCATT